MVELFANNQFVHLFRLKFWIKIKSILDFSSLFTLLEKCSLEKESFMIEKIRQIDRGILEEISYRYVLSS